MNILSKHWKYFKYLVRHKWFVLRAGIFFRAPLWRLVIHDYSKFFPTEWIPYANYFYGGPYLPWPTYEIWKDEFGVEHCKNRSDKPFKFGETYKEEVEERFNKAWLHHQHWNPHHWQYWVLREDNPAVTWRICAHNAASGPWTVSRNNVALHVYGEDPVDPMNRVSSDQLQEIVDILNTAAMAIEMPEHFVREMVADWVGAGRAQGFNDPWKWYESNKKKMILHPNTRSLVERLITQYRTHYEGSDDSH